MTVAMNDAAGVLEEYYARKGAARNDLLHNPEVLFQTLAYQRALTIALGSIPVNVATACLLDVGCGFGTNLLALLGLGFQNKNMSGIDMLTDRLNETRQRLPGVTFIAGDAARMPFGDEQFDITTIVGVFLQIMEDDVWQGIASEAIRGTKRGGYIIIGDWRYARPRDTKYNAVSMKKLRRIFGIGDQTQVHKIVPGALIPPVGRFLSKYCGPLYFFFQWLFPFLVGQQFTVLRKN